MGEGSWLRKPISLTSPLQIEQFYAILCILKEYHFLWIFSKLIIISLNTHVEISCTKTCLFSIKVLKVTFSYSLNSHLNKLNLKCLIWIFVTEWTTLKFTLLWKVRHGNIHKLDCRLLESFWQTVDHSNKEVVHRSR